MSCETSQRLSPNYYPTLFTKTFYLVLYQFALLLYCIEKRTKRKQYKYLVLVQINYYGFPKCQFNNRKNYIHNNK